jgi:two-component system, LytTR family, response regulator
MKGIRTIIIEDEPIAMAKTAEFASRIPYLEVVRTFDNSIEACSFVQTENVDLILLDIKMDELSGIELLEIIKPSCSVIITTAYTEYALKGFDLAVTDYLLKPFTFDRFLKAAEKARQECSQPEREFMFVRTEYRFEKIMLDEILYIEGMRDYRRIHTPARRLMTLQTFGEFEKTIPENIVCRVHKSYMVGVSKITSVQRDRIRIGDTLIPVSETYKKRFLEIVNIRTGHRERG